MQLFQQHKDVKAFSSAIATKVKASLKLSKIGNEDRIEMINVHLFHMCGGIPHEVDSDDIAVAALAVDWIKRKESLDYRARLSKQTQ
jgi:hypothetical protein